MSSSRSALRHPRRAVARLQLEGGPSVVDYYGSPFVLGGDAFDCRLLLQGRRLELGKTYEVPVKFLNWQLVGPRLAEGTRFVLWEGKDVAVGSILRILAK